MSGLTKNHIEILEVLAHEPWDWRTGSNIEKACFKRQGWSYQKTGYLEKRGYVEKSGGSVRITPAGQTALSLAKPKQVRP